MPSRSAALNLRERWPLATRTDGGRSFRAPEEARTTSAQDEQMTLPRRPE
jgi:hypothetical protein